MNSRKNRSARPHRQLWIVPLIVLLIIAVTGGGYFAFSQLQALSAENQRIRSSESQIKESEKAALAEKKKVLDKTVFYEGIYVNELPLAGLTRDAAAKLLAAEEKKVRDTFKAEITAGPHKLSLTPEQAGIAFDTEAVLATAYETGRKSTATSEAAQISERHAIVEALKQKPLKLKITAKASPDSVRQAILAWAAGLGTPAVDARAVSFDTAARTFKFEEAKPGLKVDATAVADEAAARLASGTFQFAGSARTEVLAPANTAASMQAKLGLVSTAQTLAGSESSKARDNNVTKIVTRLNGLVLQPGETFSFNGTFGQRTAEKGFSEAGGIRDGILVQELGGGICQPNTTLYQAVLKADLQIVTRTPHSWPSAYTAVGLDATVSWPGPDFKFTNNTSYPIAITASFRKPNIVFSVYGRKLEPGVSISLETEHNGYVKEDAPVEKTNPLLPAGTRVEVRKPRTGQKATSYKIWKKDGVVFKKEIVAVSNYKPIQGIYETGTGPAATPTPTVKPTATPTPAGAASPAPSPSPAPART